MGMQTIRIPIKSDAQIFDFCIAPEAGYPKAPVNVDLEIENATILGRYNYAALSIGDLPDGSNVRVNIASTGRCFIGGSRSFASIRADNLTRPGQIEGCAIEIRGKINVYFSGHPECLVLMCGVAHEQSAALGINNIDNQAYIHSPAPTLYRNVYANFTSAPAPHDAPPTMRGLWPDAALVEESK